MQKRTATGILLTMLAGCFPGIVAIALARQIQNTPTFSVSVDLVKIPIILFDEQGGVITDLRADDFRIYEDGKSQKIRSFSMDTNPVSVVLLLDASGTVEKELKQIKEAAEGFADALSKGDRISVITFADSVDLVLDWTEDTRQVRKVLRKVEPGLRTNLYDAMLKASQDQLHGVDGRKAIILLTDFLNNQSVVGYQDSVRAIVQSQATVYIISKTTMVRRDAAKQRRVMILNDIYSRLFGEENYIEEFFAKKEREMVDLAERTGGRCYFPSGYNEIKGVYQQVAKELKNQYYLTYVSEGFKEANSFHNIAVECLKASSRLVYRKGYFYKPEPVFRLRR